MAPRKNSHNAILIVGLALSITCHADNPVTGSTNSNEEFVNIVDVVDSVTGKKYQELRAKFTVDKFNWDHVNSLETIIGINNYAIYQPTAISNPVGRLKLPTYIMPQGKLELSIGKKAELYCRVVDHVPRLEKFCKVSCNIRGSREFKFNKYCSLEGNKDYFLKIN